MFDEYIIKAVNREDLSFREATDAMDEIMRGGVEEISLSSFLTAMKMKGEVPGELAGFAFSMIKNAESFKREGYLIDTCGTGGDGKGTINVSTISALIAACAGVRVAKHGNRAVSGKCGSADVLEALGIRIDLSSEQTAEQIEETNFGFLFAPVYHKAMKNAMTVRRKLNFPTVFNILGPLSNPARVDAQVLGVFKKELVEPMAKVLEKLGIKRALVVHGTDGYDEISISDKTHIAEIRDGGYREYAYTPHKMMSYKGSAEGPVYNAQIIGKMFENRIFGAQRELVLNNAAAAIYIGNKADTLEQGYEAADEILQKKLGTDKLNQILMFQQNLSQEKAV
jgi:anthranilate phosphoribosyltransferase